MEGERRETMYEFAYDQISEGGAGAYLWSIMGKEGLDWQPIILPMMFLWERRN